MFDARAQAVVDRVDALRDQVDDHWQIPRDEAELLAQLLRIGRCTSICEVGTSYGYSTLHLAAATRPLGGHVHSIDIEPRKYEAARKHLQEADLLDVVSLYLGDARKVLATIEPVKPFDFVFFDATKAESLAYLQAVWPKLSRPAVLVTDNSVTHADEVAAFVAHLRDLPAAHSCLVPVGNGFELTWLSEEG